MRGNATTGCALRNLPARQIWHLCWSFSPETEHSYAIRKLPGARAWAWVDQKRGRFISCSAQSGLWSCETQTHQRPLMRGVITVHRWCLWFPSPVFIERLEPKTSDVSGPISSWLGGLRNTFNRNIIICRQKHI